MCAATVYSSLFLFTLIFLVFSKKMYTEGLPIRQERGIDKGILAGADFLSVFMRQAHPDEKSTTVSYNRETRSPSTDETLSKEDRLNDFELKGLSNSDGLILAITDRRESDTIEPITEPSSEKFPSLIAEANKNEFNVEESEPVTTKLDEFSSYPAEVHSLTNSQFQQHLLYDITTEKLWERHERHYNNHRTLLNTFSNRSKENTTEKKITTERNWETDEKSYVPQIYGQPEQNYEVDESASVMTNGRVHGVQPSNNPTLPSAKDTKSKKNDQKVGYVVEGRNYRKYRVEERTSDGFIVGEYGVVSHNDGSLRGVRYTADGTISPRLIYDALMKFLAL